MSQAARKFVAALALAGAFPVMVHAAYFKWETVELPASSGASCGNGTPYRFFVNRTPFTSKTVVIFEGGGACWDQNACLGKGNGALGLSILSASNPNGVPADYMTNLGNLFNGGMSGLALGGLITPFAMRNHPLQSVQTQSWNIVYAPYCTGDVHAGNKVTVYSDADPTKPLTYFHRGSINGEQIGKWMAANMPRADFLLITGFSAGGRARWSTMRRCGCPPTRRRRRCCRTRARCSRSTAPIHPRSRRRCCCTTRCARPGAWTARTAWPPS